jgi:hypothetical protein
MQLRVRYMSVYCSNLREMDGIGKDLKDRLGNAPEELGAGRMPRQW